MKFTVNWLKQYVDFDLSPEELAGKLTMAGLEVDAVEHLFHDLDRVVVGRIESVEKHPNADKLSLCKVNVGAETLPIVCGAPNAKAGMLSALAMVGAKLPNGFEIKSAKIRGEISKGMLCSEKDLGISDDHGGIMVLDETLTPGQPLAEALALKDTVIEVDLTPNRPDCTSVTGVAREVAGFAGSTMRKPVSEPSPGLNQTTVPFSVEVIDKEACPRYAAKLFRNATIAPSPWWLQRLLHAVGLRPINNVVDITNFVMLEYGQPLHAFDFQTLAGGKIVVRKARQGEKMTTLDGSERELDEQMLLICDADKPVAVAGVMGGENSEVTESTTDILLESAYFDPISIRRTARQLKMGTDASYRFERGIDPHLPPVALERAAQLIVELTGAEAVEGGIDACARLPEAQTIPLRVQRTQDLLGVSLNADDLIRHLASIEIAATKRDEDNLKVIPPSFRVDLEREVDLVEEVARIIGYNEIPSSLPAVPMSFSEKDAERSLRQEVTRIMTGLGFSEAINYSFISQKHFDMIALAENDPSRRTVNILNPLTEDQGVMRTTLLPGLLENVRHNLNRQSVDIRLFEIGKVFLPSDGNELPHEPVYLGAILSGRRTPGASVLHYGEDATDLLDAKGVVEAIAASLRIDCLDIQPAQSIDYGYGSLGEWLNILADGKCIGSLGLISKNVLKAFGIKQDIYYLELDLSAVQNLPTQPRQFQPLSRFPSVKWDLAFVVGEEVGGGDLAKTIETSELPYVSRVEVFDVYRGKPIAEGSKSIALSVTYHSDEQTLDDETVGKIHQKVIDMVVDRFGGQLREV